MADTTLPGAVATPPPSNQPQVGAYSTTTGLPLAVSTLGSTTNPVTIPGSTGSTTADGVHGMNSSVLDSISKANDQVIADAKNNATESKGTLQSIYDKITGVQSSRADEETKAGIPGKTQDFTDAQNALNASKAARESELTALDGQGLTDIQKQQQTAEINRKYATADITLGVALSAAQGNLTTAKNLVDSKIKMELEPLQTQLEEAKTFYNENEKTLTDVQKSALTDKIAALKDQYTQTKADRKEVSDNYTKLLETNPQFLKNNPSVAGKLANAQSGMEFDKILSDNGGSLVKPTPLKSTTSGDFTKTQLNKGADNAGMTLADFKALAPDVQNYFANSPASKLSAIYGTSPDANGKAGALYNVKNGLESAADVKAEIDSSNNTAAVKAYLKKQVDSATPSKSNSGDHWWSKIANFFQ